MKALITGGTGFIGTNLSDKFAKLNIPYQSISRANGHDLLNLVDGVTKGYEYIFHLAADLDVRSSLESPKSFISYNLNMTLNLLEDMKNHNPQAKLVFLSSERVYGSSKDDPLKETSSCIPIDPYGCSKLLCENAIQTYSNLFDIDYMVLRPSIVFGPKQKGNLFIPSVISKAKSGEKEITVGKLHMMRNFVHVDDLTDLLLDTLEKPFESAKTYNVASYHLPMSAIANKISDMTGIQIIQSSKKSRPSKVEMNGSKLDTSALVKDYAWSKKRSFNDAMESLL